MKKICALMFGERRCRTENERSVKAEQAAAQTNGAAETREPRFYAVDVANYG
jgi:hypothetical protein